MKIHCPPTTLYDTVRDAKRDGYMPWLMDFSYASERLTGNNSIYDLNLAKPLRRWFLAGKSPVEAVKLSRQRYVRGATAEIVLPDTCIGCQRPHSTRGGQFCGRCRAA